MWGLARILQEAADRHASSAGLGFAQLVQDNKAWVLSRVYYHVNRLPREGEEVTVSTWSRGNDGLFAFRDYQLTDTNNNILVASTSYWVIIDLIGRKAIRLHSLMNDFESHPDLATDRSTIDRVRIPRQLIMQQVSQFPVKPSMLDHNGHVNNAEYIKWIFDNLSPEALSVITDSFRFTIEYYNETPPDDNVSVSRASGEDCTYFQVSNSRSVAVTAQIES